MKRLGIITLTISEIAKRQIRIHISSGGKNVYSGAIYKNTRRCLCADEIFI